MRLSETKIKEAILNPDVEIRQRAIGYFSESFSTDVSVMPLVIKAVETYGREEAYQLIGAARRLSQTRETIDWIIDELNHGPSDQYENYTYNLSSVLLEADPALLVPKESKILGSRHFLVDLREPFLERLQMLAWDAETCWQKLQEYGEETKDKFAIEEVNLGYGNRIVEALARHGAAACEARVQAILSSKFENYDNNPLLWLEPLAVRLAGETRLETMIPLVIAKLLEDGGDVLNEQCGRALVRIGTPAVLEAVAETYGAAPDHFRIYAIEPLEHIHSDLAVEKCLYLLQREKDHGIQVQLGYALLSHLPTEGIEVVRDVLLGRQLDFESRGLRSLLLDTCDILGQRFPEYDAWKAAEQAEKAEHAKRLQELEGDPLGLLRFAVEKFTGKQLPAPAKKKRPAPPAIPLDPVTTWSESKPKVGRNDPCPCGSGKKFKQCCLKKGG